MPFTPGQEFSGGRPKGAENKETKKLREALTALTIGGMDDFITVLAELREENRVKYAEYYLKLLEYSIPKMRSVDTNLSVDQESLGAIKIEVISKQSNERTEDTSN
jgi:hypothetical protein